MSQDQSPFAPPPPPPPPGFGASEQGGAATGGFGAPAYSAPQPPSAYPQYDQGGPPAAGFQPVVDPGPAPKRKRTGLIVAIAVAVVAVLGVGGFFLLSGGDDKPKETFSLTAATDRAARLDSVSFEMTMEVPFAGETTIEATVENSTNSVELKMQFFGIEFHALVDTPKQEMYMKAALLEGLPGMSDVDTEWVKLDLERLEDLDVFGELASLKDAAGGNPLDVTSAFEDAADVEEIGFDEVDGVRVKHYRVTVDTEDALAANPGLEEQLGGVGGDLPDTIVYDVFVDEDNLLRRLMFSLEVDGEEISVDFLITGIDEDATIEFPDDDEVTDVTDLVLEEEG